MNFEANKPIYIIVMLMLMILCLSMPTKTIITPSPIGIEITPDVAVNVQSAVPDILVEPEINVLPNVYEQRYTPELIRIVYENRDFPYSVNSIDSVYQGNGLWIVTVTFNSFEVKSKRYIFDEVNP